jgi:hypothetical protein
VGGAPLGYAALAPLSRSLPPPLLRGWGGRPWVGRFADAKYRVVRSELCLASPRGHGRGANVPRAPYFCHHYGVAPSKVLIAISPSVMEMPAVATGSPCVR